MPRRVKRASDTEDIYKQLTEGDYKVFNTMKDVFLLSASIGFKEEKNQSFEKVGGEIPWSVFRGDTDESIINSIAIAETSDMHVLLSDEETIDRKLKICEEYANYGIRVIKQRIIDSPGDPIDNLVSLIMENDTSTGEVKKPSDFLDKLFQ
ncbi:DNA phosphorothioation-associated protein 4 [Paenibacillus oleatilyticus]|uniref:DNA phosphorothioation-associated protein 4 n=1 Tax=Paenibacillus oleatilyticus TaxID=2594886 RepID=UPI001C1FA8C1|nr:DNA phosphorothioation-associated protein 4 [Paenibacillus oleatilyticus]MBU7315376.1 DNA phosphorothioation-associated protein 4 [Paenibacillus oleatilyticus]